MRFRSSQLAACGVVLVLTCEGSNRCPLDSSQLALDRKSRD